MQGDKRSTSDRLDSCHVRGTTEGPIKTRPNHCSSSHIFLSAVAVDPW